MEFRTKCSQIVATRKEEFEQIDILHDPQLTTLTFMKRQTKLRVMQ
jgi:hypothetical protein